MVCWSNMNAPRRPSVEIASLGEGRLNNAPAPPADITMRQWFAGLALGNPELMKGVPQGKRVSEALRLADEMTLALKTKVPTVESMAAPTEVEMQHWDQQVESRGRPTMPARARALMLPPPNVERRPPPSSPGKYSWTEINLQPKNSPPPSTARTLPPGAGEYSIKDE